MLTSLALFLAFTVLFSLYRKGKSLGKIANRTIVRDKVTGKHATSLQMVTRELFTFVPIFVIAIVIAGVQATGNDFIIDASEFFIYSNMLLLTF